MFKMHVCNITSETKLWSQDRSVLNNVNRPIWTEEDLNALNGSKWTELERMDCMDRIKSYKIDVDQIDWIGSNKTEVDLIRMNGLNKI